MITLYMIKFYMCLCVCMCVWVCVEIYKNSNKEVQKGMVH